MDCASEVRFAAVRGLGLSVMSVLSYSLKVEIRLAPEPRVKAGATEALWIAASPLLLPEL
jgi:hypothetical protein